MSQENPELKRILTPTMVWGLGVGYVISGNYFGWNLGLQAGGTLGLAIAVAFVILLYITFTYSYAELACAIPKAGGAFDYANRALGPRWGFLAGMAQNIEFIFAPPAIALAIGSYLNLFFPAVGTTTFSVGGYLIFTALNIYGVRLAALVELGVTVVAVAGLLVFAANAVPAATFNHLAGNALPQGMEGIFAAIPFAIWFFLGIEGIGNLAEETVDPRRTMSRGFLAALFTLIVLCVLTFVGSVGVGGWEAVVLKPDGTTSDAPLPMALEVLRGAEGWPYTMLIIFGLFGLVASFYGLMLAAGRSTFEFGKVNFPGSWLGTVHPRFQTPANALLFNMVLGGIAVFTGRTAEIITLSVFGALTLYVVSMIAVIVLRKKEPELQRPFRVPFYPSFPIIALVIASVALLAVIVYNLKIAAVYVVIIGLCFGIFNTRKSDNAA